MIKAVITGDIVKSTDLSTEHAEKLLKKLAQMLTVLDKKFGMRSEIFRGDSFQCLTAVENGLPAALAIKTFIRALNPSEIYDLNKRKDPGKKSALVVTNHMFDARISLGIGDATTSSKTLASAQSEAFIISGHLLDEIKGSKQRFIMGSYDEYDGELETESFLIDTILSKTSALQCQVLYPKIMGFTEIQIASKLNIAQSAVNQRASNGNWPALEHLLYRYNEIYMDHE